MYPFLDHLNFLHIGAFYLKQIYRRYRATNAKTNDLISRVNCFYFYSRILSIKHALNVDIAGYLRLGNFFLFSISFVFLLELVMIMKNLIYNNRGLPREGLKVSFLFRRTKWQLKSFFQLPDGKFWLLVSVHKIFASQRNMKKRSS